MTDTEVEVAEVEYTKVPAQIDYFGVDTTHKLMLPDGVSWVEHKVMTEGDRRAYLKKTNKNVKLDKRGDATIQVAPGEERAALLEASLCGWNLKKEGMETPFNGATLRLFMDKADPKIIDLIEKDIRSHNTWLGATLTVEGIDEEIASLQETREELLQEEAGKATS
jgi:hypothetical protein